MCLACTATVLAGCAVILEIFLPPKFTPQGQILRKGRPSRRRALVGDRTRADDLVQDCLERAWSRSHLFRSEGDIRVWLFAILHNLYVSTVRRQSRQPAMMPLTDKMESQPIPSAPESRLEIADLERALAVLPVDQRAAGRTASHRARGTA